MEVRVRSLGGRGFTVTLARGTDATVGDLRAAVASHTGRAVAHLVYLGRFLKSDSAPLTLSASEFVVAAFAKQRKKPRPVAAVPDAGSAAGTLGSAAAASSADTTPASPTPASPAATGGGAAGGGGDGGGAEGRLCCMGFPRARVVAALRASDGAEHQAMNLLLSGAEIPAPSVNGGGSGRVSPDRGSADVMERLRSMPLVARLRSVAGSDPDALQEALSDISQSPDVDFIAAHMAEFMRVVAESSDIDADAFFDGDLVSDGASSPSDETDGDDDDEQSPAAGAASEEWEGIQRTASGEGGFAGAGEFDPDTMGDAYRQLLDMGADEGQVRGALAASGGDIQLALSLLFS